MLKVERVAVAAYSKDKDLIDVPYLQQKVADAQQKLTELAALVSQTFWC